VRRGEREIRANRTREERGGKRGEEGEEERGGEREERREKEIPFNGFERAMPISVIPYLSKRVWPETYKYNYFSFILSASPLFLLSLPSPLLSPSFHFCMTIIGSAADPLINLNFCSDYSAFSCVALSMPSNSHPLFSLLSSPLLPLSTFA
jgi:hypothetical protein